MVEKDYTVKVSTADAVKNVDKLTKAVEEQNDELLIMEGKLLDAERALSKLGPKQLNRIKDTKDYIKQLKQKITLEKKGAKLLSASQKKATRDLVNAKKASVDYSGVVGKLDAQTGGLISGFSGMVKGLKNATKGFKTMKLAIISTGLGALVVVMGALYAAFTSSEEGQKKWAAVMEVVGAVVSVFKDRLAALGSGLISLFTEPIETLKGFGKSIKEFVMDKVEQAVEGLGFMGSAISKLFKGNLTGALNDASKGVLQLNRALNPAVMIVEAMVEGTKKLVTELTKEAKVALMIAADKKKAHKIENELITERAIAERDRQSLLDKAAKKDIYSAAQRIKFLEEAGKVEDKINEKQIKLAKLKLKTQQDLNEQGLSDKKDIKAELELKAQLINLETQRLVKAKQLSSQLVSVRKEEAARIQQIDDEADAKALAIQDFKDSLRIKDKENKFADIEAEREDRIKELEELRVSKTLKEQMLLDIEASFKEKKKVIEDEAKVIEDEKLAAFLEKETEEKEIALEDEKQAALDKAKRLGASKKQLLQIETNYVNQIADAEDAANDAKLEMAKKTLGGIAAALGENSKAGKAAAAASALINTYQGITAELATKTATPFGFAMKLVNIATTAAIGFKSVKSILATNPSSGGGNATNPGAGAAMATAEPVPPQPPAFNVVGASDTNQLADAIGGQAQQPVQAFVVSGDVTTAQSLERNIIQGATIG
jgi:hypothetical protein